MLGYFSRLCYFLLVCLVLCSGLWGAGGVFGFGFGSGDDFCYRGLSSLGGRLSVSEFMVCVFGLVA